MSVGNYFRGSRRAGAAGFSLIEVLVAMFILAVGLLGLAALQAQGLRSGSAALVRTQATILANEIIDQMRANRSQIAAYQNANVTALIAAAAARKAANPNDTACRPAQSVTNDLTCWAEHLVMALPGVSASLDPIAPNAADPTYTDVVLSWTDRDPRTYPDGTHPPLNRNQCLYSNGVVAPANLIPARAWDATANTCLVTQTWTWL